MCERLWDTWIRFFMFSGKLSLVKREERKPTRCNNIDDLLSIVDVDY